MVRAGRGTQLYRFVRNLSVVFPRTLKQTIEKNRKIRESQNRLLYTVFHEKFEAEESERSC